MDSAEKQIININWVAWWARFILLWVIVLPVGMLAITPWAVSVLPISLVTNALWLALVVWLLVLLGASGYNYTRLGSEQTPALRGDPLGILREGGGKYSLGRVQLVLWTLVVIPAFLALTIIRLFTGVEPPPTSPTGVLPASTYAAFSDYLVEFRLTEGNFADEANVLAFVTLAKSDSCPDAASSRQVQVVDRTGEWQVQTGVDGCQILLSRTDPAGETVTYAMTANILPPPRTGLDPRLRLNFSAPGEQGQAEAQAFKETSRVLPLGFFSAPPQNLTAPLEDEGVILLEIQQSQYRGPVVVIPGQLLALIGFVAVSATGAAISNKKKGSKQTASILDFIVEKEEGTEGGVSLSRLQAMVITVGVIILYLPIIAALMNDPGAAHFLPEVTIPTSAGADPNTPTALVGISQLVYLLSKGNPISGLLGK